MRKLRTTETAKNKNNDPGINKSINGKIPFFMKDFNRTTGILLLLSWILPFYSLFFIYLAKMELPEKSKIMVCKILNMGFTVILVEFILVSAMQMLIFSGIPAIVYSLMAVIALIFLWAVANHIIATLKWLKDEDYSYKFTPEFFKPWEAANKAG